MTDRPLRILTVLNAFECDGPGIFVRNLLNHPEISNHPGIDSRVIAISRDGDLRKDFKGSKPLFLDGRSPSGILSLTQKIKSLYHDNRGPDIIHTHLLWPDLLFRFLKKQFPGCKLVSTCHGLHASAEKGLFGKIYNQIESRTRNRCDGWVAVSEHVAREMISNGYSAEKVTAIPNGIDPKVFRNNFPEAEYRDVRSGYGIPDDAPFLVSVGNLRAVKDQETMIKAVWRIRQHHPDVRLILFGDGPLRVELKRLIFKFGMQKNIRIHPPVYDHLNSVLGAADLFLTSSIYESFGLAVGESILCGTPVVASNGGALPEMVQEDLTGETFPVGDDEKMALAVVNLLNDDSRRKRLGETCAEWGSKHLHIRTSAKRYREYWTSLANS